LKGNQILDLLPELKEEKEITVDGNKNNILEISFLQKKKLGCFNLHLLNVHAEFLNHV
jgi:hypothetical protein